jgi:ankyrin repeat protein
MKSQLIAIVAAVLVVGCSKPAPPDISIHDAAYEGNIEAVKQHLASGADVNEKAEDGVAPLHVAAQEGHNQVIELLIDNGADVNSKDGDEGAPLHMAAANGHKGIAELLIVKGADVNAKIVDGGTPLDYAEAEIADLLRKHGGKTGEELKAEGK